MIAENPFLERLNISAADNMIKFERIVLLLFPLQCDTTLKTLCQLFYPKSFFDDEVNQLV
jgi:hypothetical protein